MLCLLGFDLPYRALEGGAAVHQAGQAGSAMQLTTPALLLPALHRLWRLQACSSVVPPHNIRMRCSGRGSSKTMMAARSWSAASTHRCPMLTSQVGLSAAW